MRISDLSNNIEGLNYKVIGFLFLFFFIQNCNFQVKVLTCINAWVKPDIQWGVMYSRLDLILSISSVLDGKWWVVNSP